MILGVLLIVTDGVGLGELLTNVTGDGDGVTVTDGVLLGVGNGDGVIDGVTEGSGGGHVIQSSQTLYIVSSIVTIVGLPSVIINTV